MALRVTHRSLFSSNLANLQQNLSRIQNTQQKMSSGKVLQLPSDSPSDTGAALKHRSGITRGEQLKRNADDGIGWLTNADSSLSDSISILGRVRELLVQANNPLDQQASDAIAAEIEGLRGSLLSVANREYLGRPIFSGTADVASAYDDAGTYLGNDGVVERSVRPGTRVRVNVTGEEVFGAPGDDTFQLLTDVVDHLRNDRTQLSQDLADADVHLGRITNQLSTVGSRYQQVEDMRIRNEDEILLSRHQLSELEDIDLPATIVELQLQETAYQAALSATARSVQPSLLDFLR